MRRLNGERRSVFLAAMTRAFGDDIEIVGTTAGLHVVVWFNTTASEDEERFAGIARTRDIGIYLVARLFAAPIGRSARGLYIQLCIPVCR